MSYAQTNQNGAGQVQLIVPSTTIITRSTHTKATRGPYVHETSFMFVAVNTRAPEAAAFYMFLYCLLRFYYFLCIAVYMLCLLMLCCHFVFYFLCVV